MKKSSCQKDLEIENSISEADARKFNDFLRSLNYNNSTAKGGRKERYDKLNKELINHINDSGFKINDALDIGTCSGLSALELLNDLRNAGHETEMTGTDINFQLFKLNLFGIDTGVDKWRNLMWLKVGYKKFSNKRNSLDKLIYVFVQFAIKKIIPINHNKSGREVVSLIMPQLEKSTIVFIEDDITIFNIDFNNKFDLIRVADVFSPGFPITTGNSMTNLKFYLKPEGYLFIIDKQYGGLLYRKVLNELHFHCSIGKIRKDDRTVYYQLEQINALKGW